MTTHERIMTSAGAIKYGPSGGGGKFPSQEWGMLEMPPSSTSLEGLLQSDATTENPYALRLRVDDLVDRYRDLEARVQVVHSALLRIAALQRPRRELAPSLWFAQRIVELTSLDDGWDDEGAARIPETVGKRALAVAAATANVAGEPEPIPARGGAIQLLWTATADDIATLYLEPNQKQGGRLTILHGLSATVREIVSDAEIPGVLRADLLHA